MREHTQPGGSVKTHPKHRDTTLMRGADNGWFVSAWLEGLPFRHVIKIILTRRRHSRSLDRLHYMFIVAGQ